MQAPSSVSSDVLVSPSTDTTNSHAYDLYPESSHVEVYWPGDKAWYAAEVTETRIKDHKLKGAKVSCREIHCVYELDAHEQWHSLHNNRIRMARAKPQSGNSY